MEDMLTRQALAVILLQLLAVPGWGGPSVVGNVASSRSATVRGTRLTPGSTVFSGDVIEVGPQGSARIALTEGAQVQVAEKSQVRLTKSADRVQLTIDRGLALFRTAEKSGVEVLLGDATIRPANDMSTVGILSVRSPRLAVIAAKRGALVVSTARDSKSVTLEEGQGMDVMLIPGASTPNGTAILGGTVAASGLLGAVLSVNDPKGGCSEESPPTPSPTMRGRGHCEAP